jgi:hypothetical protein
VALGVVALLLAGGVAFASLRFDALVNAVKDRQVAALAKALGRPVKVGRVKTHLLSLSVDVEDVAIASDPARPAETLPVLALGRLHVGVASRTLWSLGKRPGLTELRLEGLAVNVVKHADGSLNLLNLAQALPRDEAPPTPMDETTRALLRPATVERVRIEGGRVHFVDLARGGAAVDLSQIDLALDDVSLARPVAVTLGMAVLAPAKNLRLVARLGSAPPSLEAGPPLERLAVTLERTDLSPLAPFLAAALPADLGGLESATLALDLTIEPGAAAPGGRGPTRALAAIAVTGMRFQQGEAFDLRLDGDVGGDFAAAGGGALDIRRFTLGIGPMTVEARGKLAALATAPRFSDFALASKGFDFDRLRRFLPDLDRRAGAVLHGPFSFSAAAGGSAAAQSFEAGLDLSSASIEVPRALRKPAGVPLRLDLRGKAEGDGVDFERLGLQIADWRLGARGTVRHLGGSAPVLALTADAEAPGLAGLLRLLPPVAAGLGPRARLDGALALKARLAGSPAALHAELDVKLARLGVKVPEARLGGGGALTLVADRKGKALDATVHADFTGLEAIYLDVVRKEAGVPLVLDVVAAQAAGGEDVRLELRAADLAARGRGELRPAGDDQALSADVTVPPFRVRSLTAMLPALTETPIGDLRAGAKLRVRGRLGAPSSMEIAVEELGLTAGKSDLRGRLTVANLERPRVEMEGRSSYLDLDDFLPPVPAGKGAAARKPPAPGQPAAAGGPLAGVTGRAQLEVARGRAGGIDYQDLRADLGLTGGRAVARMLEVGVFGGRFSGAGTELSLLDEREPFKAKGTLSKIDVDAVVTHFVGAPGLLAGRLDATVALGGAGTVPSVLEQTLEGFLEGGLQQAELLGGDFLASLLAPLALKVNALPGAGRLLDASGASFKKYSDRALAEVRTNLKIERGAVNLTRPVTFETTSGPVRLDGRVLLGGKWDLAGVLTLSPAAATALAGGRLAIDQPVPIKLAVTGPLAHPRVAPTALDEVARVYALAFARSAAGRAVHEKVAAGAKELLGKSGLADKVPAGAAPATVDEAKAEAAAAEARAKAEAEEVRRRADEARAKAEAEARARAEEAKQQAAQKGKEKLRGLLGR